MITIIFVTGLLSLIRNVISDFKTKLIDDRANYYMLGTVITYALFSNVNLWILYGTMGFSILITILLLKFTKTGVGDLSAFNWINIGLACDSLKGLLIFWLLMGICFVAISLRYKILKVETPYYPFITIAFIISYILA